MLPEAKFLFLISVTHLLISSAITSSPMIETVFCMQTVLDILIVELILMLRVQDFWLSFYTNSDWHRGQQWVSFPEVAEILPKCWRHAGNIPATEKSTHVPHAVYHTQQKVHIETLTDFRSTVEAADKVRRDVHLWDVWSRAKVTQLQHQLRVIDLHMQRQPAVTES